jgi:hypothetical protein
VPEDAEVVVTVGFGPRSENGLGLEIALDITLPGVARKEAQAWIEKAHQICAYSDATRNNVAVKLGLHWAIDGTPDVIGRSQECGKLPGRQQRPRAGRALQRSSLAGVSIRAVLERLTEFRAI